MFYDSMKVKIGKPLPIWEEVGALMCDDFDYYVTPSGYKIDKSEAVKLHEIQTTMLSSGRTGNLPQFSFDNLKHTKLDVWGRDQISLIKEAIKDKTTLFIGVPDKTIERLCTDEDLIYVSLNDHTSKHKKVDLDKDQYSRILGRKHDLYDITPECIVIYEKEHKYKRLVNENTYIIRQGDINS